MRFSLRNVRNLFFGLILLSTAVTAQSEAARLETGKTIGRELKGGESHAYPLPLTAGQFVSIKTEQKGIDVSVKLVDASGASLLEIDSANGTKGEEPLWFVAEVAGEYRIEVASLEKGAAAGKYEITLADSRAATTEDLDATARFLGNQGRELFGRNNLKARELALRSISIAENTGTKRIIGNNLGLIGNTYAMDGDLNRAVEYHERSLVIRREINDQQGIAFAFNNLGIVYNALGNYDKSADSFNQAFEMLKVTEKGNAAVILFNIGNVHKARGDYAKAMTYYQRSALMFEEAGVKPMPPDVAINFASGYKALGNFELATAYYEKALADFTASKNNYGLSQTLDGLGGTYFQMGDYIRSIEYLKRAIAIEEKMSARTDLAGALRQIGDAYFKLGDTANADQNYRRGLELAEEVSPSTGISLRLSIAKMQLAQGDRNQGISTAEQARGAFESIVGRGTNSDLYYTLGQAYLAAGHADKAKRNFEMAAEEIETARQSSFALDETLGGLYVRRNSPYHSLLEILHSQRLDSSAFELAERAKSGTIIDVLQNSKIDNNGALTDEERVRERSIKNDLVSLNLRISKLQGKTGADAAELIRLQDQLQKKRLEFEDFRTRTYAMHPALRIERGEMKSVTLKGVSDLLTDDGSALLEYAVSDKKTFLFAITKGPSGPQLRVHEIALEQNALSRLAKRYRDKLGAGDLDFQPAARELYDLLLKPAQSQLVGKTNLIIVPDGPLWDLPFQALQDERGKYLIEKAAVSYAPSLTALKEMSKKAKARTRGDGLELLAFGNPIVAKETSERVRRVFMSEKLEPLPESERLVNELGKMYGADRSKVFTGDQAREEIAKAEAQKYRIVQFATHGILNNVSPMYSHLVLAQNEKNPNEDGLLEAWELKDLDLKADMVILSACETARGRISGGEGVIGMTWASFIAGAPTTVASQWKVESSSTTELMLEFHRQLLAKKRVSKAEALRRASLRLMKMPQYRHPSYWAGFVLVGDGS